MSAEDQKRAVGQAAAALVETGMTVGLGTGSTAAHMVRALGWRVEAEALKLRCVATSDATGSLARDCGLTLVSLDEAGELDLTLDGADEIGPGLGLIKGGGAALLREKLVWRASRRCVAIADSSKVVDRLGAFALPVEVVAFGHGATARRIAAVVEALALEGRPSLRMRDGAPLRDRRGRRDLRPRLRDHRRPRGARRRPEGRHRGGGSRPVPGHGRERAGRRRRGRATPHALSPLPG